MRNYLEIALQYCDDVKTGVRIAGKLEKLAVDRFLRDLSRSGFALSDDVSVERLLTKLKVKTKPDISFPYILNLRRAEHACFLSKHARMLRENWRSRIVMDHEINSLWNRGRFLQRLTFSAGLVLKMGCVDFCMFISKSLKKWQVYVAGWVCFVFSFH